MFRYTTEVARDTSTNIIMSRADEDNVVPTGSYNPIRLDHFIRVKNIINYYEALLDQ